MRTSALVATIAACCATLVGCRDAAAPGAGVLPPISRDTPEELAATWLTYVRAELSATSRHDRAWANTVSGQATVLFAAQTLERSAAAAIADRAGLRAVYGDRPVAAFARNWTSMILYYIDDLDVARAERRLTSDGGTRVVLALPCARHAPTTVFLDCEQDREQRWTIAHVGFDAPRAARAPSTAPATTLSATNSSQPH